MEPLKFNTLDNVMGEDPVNKLSRQALESIKSSQVTPPSFDLPPHFVSPVIRNFENGKTSGGDCQYLVVHDNEQSGPFTPVQIKEMILTGIFDLNTLVWKQGMSQWVKITDCQEIVKLLKQQSNG